MWLSVASLFGFLRVIQEFHFSEGRELNTHHDPCVAKILSCDWYRQPFSPYQDDIGMFTNIEDLKKACKIQEAYVRCIARAEKFCKKTTTLFMAKEMLINRRFAADVCRPTSPWQQLYLNEARCLNSYASEDVLFCIYKFIREEPLETDNTVNKGCKYERNIVDCSATLLHVKCGYYAGNILRKFLMFHSLSEYKCSNYKPEAKAYILNYTPNLDMQLAISNIIGNKGGDFESTEETDSVKTSEFEETKTLHIETQGVRREHLQVKKLKDTFPPDMELKDVTKESDKFEFPALPLLDYVHKNKTTFALYEDLEMGLMNYIGCGEADIYWVQLSSLKSKYCTLTDLQSEYSEGFFKCTVLIDAPCSPELDDEDAKKNAEVFHNRYVTTVLTPPNKQRLEDMAIMNVHYLKVYPSPSKYATEKRVNLWTADTNRASAKRTKPDSRQGLLELEEDPSDFLYHHGNGSGQKRKTYTVKYPQHLSEDDYEYENWNDYLQDEDDDIYFPETLANNIIYIDDDEGGLISLHDHRSPIYSNSLYQPHSLFRPRTGEMPASTDQPQIDENEIFLKWDPVHGSLLDERFSEIQNEDSLFKVKLDKQEHCSVDGPFICLSDPETILKLEIKLDIYKLSRLIQNLKTLKAMLQKKLHQFQSSPKSNENIYAKLNLGHKEDYIIIPSSKIEPSISLHALKAKQQNKGEYTTCHPGEKDSPNPPSMKLNEDIDVKTRLDSRDVYVVVTSSNVEPSDSVQLSQAKERYDEDGLTTGLFRYPPEEEDYDNVAETTTATTPNNSPVTSGLDSEDAKIDYTEPFNEPNKFEFTQLPNKDFPKTTNIKVNPKGTRVPENLESMPPSEKKSMWSMYLAKYLSKICKIVLKNYRKYNSDFVKLSH